MCDKKGILVMGLRMSTWISSTQFQFLKEDNTESLDLVNLEWLTWSKTISKTRARISLVNKETRQMFIKTCSHNLASEIFQVAHSNAQIFKASSHLGSIFFHVWHVLLFS